MSSPPPPYSAGSGAMNRSDERTWAMASHLGVLIAAWIALGFLAPLAVLLFAGERSAFVKRHATESLNFQISLLVYTAIGTLVALITLGVGLLVIVPVAVVVALVALVTIVLATMAANRGEDYRYPLCIRLIH